MSQKLTRHQFEHIARYYIGMAEFSGHHSTGGVWVYNHNFVNNAWKMWQEFKKLSDARLADREAEIRAEYMSIAPPEQTIRTQQAEIEAYKNTVKSKDVEIERLKLDILDAWIDENGTTWFRPTSWAYAQVCRVKNEQQSTIDRLTEQHKADDKRIADLLAVIAKKDEALSAISEYQVFEVEMAETAQEALAITTESVELVEVGEAYFDKPAGTVNIDIHNTEFDGLHKLYTIKQKG